MINEVVLYNNVFSRINTCYPIAHDDKAKLLAQILKKELNADTSLVEAGILFYFAIKHRNINLNNLKNLFEEQILIIVEDSIQVIDFLFNNYHEHLKKLLELSPENKFRVRGLENIKKFIFTLIRDFSSIFIINAYYLLLLRNYPSLSPQLKDRVKKHIEFIFAPIAHRLGFYRLKSSFDDLIFKYTLPEQYNQIKEYVEKIKRLKSFSEQSQFNLDKFKNELYILLKTKLQGNYKFNIKGRIKSVSSIYKKMLKKNQSLEEIKDIFALRIIFDIPYESENLFSLFPEDIPREIKEKEYKVCWEAYSIITDKYEQIKFKNYISNPKPNGYQSLHVTVLAPGNIPVEIQIRTRRMDEVAEKGDAAHWTYKEQGSEKINRDEIFRMLRRLTEEDKTDEIRKNLNEIYVFTPDMHLINLPKDATVLDFAYSIHSRLGELCSGAQVKKWNDAKSLRIVSYKEKLENGMIVKILTSQNQKPTDEWLSIVKTPYARKKIKSYLKLQKLQPNIEAAKEMLDRKLTRWGYSLNHPIIPKVIKELGYNETYLFYNDIALGKIDLTKLKNVIKDVELQQTRTHQTPPKLVKHTQITDKVLVAIFENNSAKILFVSRARCCNPQYNEPINVYLSPKSKTVHSASCPEIQKLKQTKPERVFPAVWVKPHKKLDINELARDHTVLLLTIPANNLSRDQITDQIKNITVEANLPLKRVLVRPGKSNSYRVFIILQGKINRKDKEQLITTLEEKDWVKQIKERKYNPGRKS